MTWGVQNSQEDAFEQLDYARSMGVNFIDTAELYPVPLTAPDWRPGATEEILGNYLHKIGSSERDELVIASKVTGFFPNSPVAAVRTVPPTDPPPDGRLDAKSVQMACDASLRRLQTDRIDLMQIHWPDRYVVSIQWEEFRAIRRMFCSRFLSFHVSLSLVKPNSNMATSARILWLSKRLHLLSRI
jgi:aryl-alcohol dehydrogenase-like predicted oxidoreductase